MSGKHVVLTGGDNSYIIPVGILDKYKLNVADGEKLEAALDDMGDVEGQEIGWTCLICGEVPSGIGPQHNDGAVIPQ